MSKHEEQHNERTKLVDVVPLSHPYVLMIDPCGRCNFKCCFCPCNVSEDNKEQRHQLMSMELFEKIVSNIKEFPEKINAIDMYGFGEPLLNKHLPEMINMLKRENICEKVRLATNASLLTGEMSERLAESGLDYMKVSLEGLSDEEYQKISNVNIRYEDIVANVKNFCNIRGGVCKSA